MGQILDDILLFIGIFPMPRPLAKVKPIGWIEIEGKTNYEKLEELNGQLIWVQDFHHGVIYGKLNYNSPHAERYYLTDSNYQDIPLQVHDLENIGLRTILN